MKPGKTVDVSFRAFYRIRACLKIHSRQPHAPQQDSFSPYKKLQFFHCRESRQCVIMAAQAV